MVSRLEDYLDKSIVSSTTNFLSSYTEVSMEGDILFYLDDYKSTKITLDKQLLNFTSLPAFQNNRSLEYQTADEELLCADVDRIIKNHPDKFQNYVDCKLKFFTNGTEPHVNYEITFEGEKNPAQLLEEYNNILLKELPKERYDRWLGYRLGDLLIYYQNFTDFTEVPLKFRVLNLTWTEDLASSNSPKFRLHAERFCSDINRLLRARPDLFTQYDKCKVVQFGKSPVSIEILLEFSGRVSIPAMQQLAATVIFEDTPRYRYNQVVGHLIGDLLVYYADLLLYHYNIPFDAWLYNSTQKMYGYPWRDEERLWDSNSPKFKEIEAAFCNEMDRVFKAAPIAGNPNKERYYRCFIDNFQRNFDPEAPVSFTYSLVFNGTEPLIKQEIDDMITANIEVYDIGSSKWFLIGQQWLINEQKWDEIKINISDYLINLIATTPTPDIKNHEEPFTFRLMNFTMTPALADTSSAQFQSLASRFCTYLDGQYKNRAELEYLNCGVKRFYTEPGRGTQHVDFILTFRGDKANDPALRNKIIDIIIENAHREAINNRIALVVGPLFVAEDSLQADAVVSGSTTSPLADPCQPNKSNVYYPDPTDEKKFIVCSLGKSYTFTCENNRVFDKLRSRSNPCAPDKSGVTLPDPNDKASYFICYQGSGIGSKCSAPKVFDASKSVCVNP
ncbi:hypothetical protein DPMN_141519 [Dreissena polymorpha]|uniref:Chitin-binding type-2 domain-containing protein n=1 Tax=Dreissena polymorpha TaxID=45954 RepID=A0A9D4G9L6_DREPO|nr:hypothetical protein DPMN_141519 [Dreissena polymorpha]